MIQIERPEDCVGCSACVQACPAKCITIQADKEGYGYPIIDKKVCIHCGYCIRVCPLQHCAESNEPMAVWAARNINEEIRSTSSSGGVFYEMASAIIKNSGIVYGCALDEQLVARHIGVTTLDELNALKGSKYVQSDIGTTYGQVKENLLKGLYVLYSGTPCQIAGLKNYLGKSYDNLYLVEVLCHGVPSPKLLSDYLKYLSVQYAGKPLSINFRNKKKGWKRLYIEVVFDNGKRHFTFSGYDRYMSMFLNNISLRPSCYECKFTSKYRQGDVTLGDFWGIGKKIPKLDDDKGLSVVLINTQKGKQFFEEISHKFRLFPSDFETAAAGQRTLSRPTDKNPIRDEFYSNYAALGIKKAIESATRIPSSPVRAYYAVMRWGLDLIRKIGGKGY